jgi:hypothetical protein
LTVDIRAFVPLARDLRRTATVSGEGQVGVRRTCKAVIAGKENAEMHASGNGDAEREDRSANRPAIPAYLATAT